MTIALPREKVSVPVARRILAHALEELGAAPTCIADIELALSEACTNALMHTADSNDYVVLTGIDNERCVVEVLDTGRSFDSAAVGQTPAAPVAEQGRGIQLMRALVDDVRFERRPERGTLVHLEKMLHWSSGAPGRSLRDGHPRERPATAAASTAEDEPGRQPTAG